MPPILVSGNKDSSTKHQIILEIESEFPVIQVDITDSTTFELFYSTRLYPISLSGTTYTFKIDVASLLDKQISYLPFVLTDLKTLGEYVDMNISISEVGAGGSSIQEPILIHKARERFYPYWKIYTEGAFGFQLTGLFGTSGTATCYASSLPQNMSSMLLAYDSNNIRTDFEVEWRFNGGFTNTETLNFPIGAGHYNLGLDEIIQHSGVILTQTDRDELTGYYIYDGADWDLTVNIVRLDNCKFKPYSFLFINKWGYWESFSMPMFEREVMKINKSSYRKTPQTFSVNGKGNIYDPREVLTPIYETSNTVTNRYTTDWATEADEEQLRYLASCDVVYLKYFIENEYFLVPVSILGDTVTFRDKRKDKVYNIEFDAQFQNIDR